MALPSTVTGSWPDHRNSFIGPYLISGNLYAFTRTSSNFRAYKSADGGDSWTEQDSSNAPALAGASSPFSATQVGTTVYFAYAATGPVIKVVTFASDAWGTPTSTNPSVAPSTNISLSTPVFISVRSGGNYVVFYQGATESVMGTARRRFYYSEYNGSSWSSAVQFGTNVAAHFDLRTAILGASDRVEFVFSRSDSALAQKQSLSSANATDTAQTFSGDNSANYSVGLPVAFTNGGNTEIAIPFKDPGTGTKLYVARWNSGANAAITTTAVSDSIVPDTANSNPGAVAVDGTTKYVFFADSSTRDIYRDNDGGSNTWGTDAAQEASITCAGVNANLVTNAIGILFNDNGTVKYDAYALAIVYQPRYGFVHHNNPGIL